jgi:putative hemolysin
MDFDLISILSSAGPLLLVLLLLSISAVMSSSEVAIFSLTPAQRKELEASEETGAKNIIKLLNHPTPEIATKRLLASVLVGNNMVNIAVVLVSTILFDTWFEGSTLEPWILFLINVVGVTTLIVFIGEVIPKVYATTNNLKIAKRFAFLFLILDRVFAPIIWLLTTTSKLFDKERDAISGNISVDELGHALELTTDDNRSEEEHRILEGIVSIGEKEVVQIMTPRTDVLFLNSKLDFAAVKELVSNSGYSRFPVILDNSDSISGVLYAKDLIPFWSSDNMDWMTLQRKTMYLPESKRVDDALIEFQKDKMHLAVVVDEYGGTSGIVTLQDVLEEIVGDVTDEFDDASESLYSRLDASNFVFVAKIGLVDFCRVVEVEDDLFEAVRGDSTTLGGFIVEQLGRIPTRGEKWSFHQFDFVIESADNRKINRIKVKNNG